ncbi:hypothetical protein [Jeongeupia naejangsanensis]|uniref:Uncharacterized protein n=1 Tax=Jeongeupia naejangsanensis TaxID=613195 RepID=A0ABS2BKE1_9NEIS|nr:hypothetical protein [Jeongeupia naejangsanensis]MBM3116066.1 hypothetical protein [Jeongeupia naejangsanensis]
MTSTLSSYSDSEIEAQVITPAGGLSCFRLVACPGYKLIEYRLDDGDFLGLILEEDILNRSAIQYLEKKDVPEIDWNDRLR